MRTFNLHIKIALFILAVLLLLQVVFLYQHNQTDRDSKNQVVHTYQVINTIRGLYNTLKDAEISQLSSALVKPNIPAQNDPYVENIHKTIVKLRDMTRDNLQQQNNINSVQKLIDQELLLMKNQQSPDRLAILRSNIESSILNMIHVEEKLLTSRKIAHEKAANDYAELIVIGSAFSYIVIVSLIFLFIKTVKRLYRSESRLERAVKGTSDGLWDWDPRTNEVYFSPRVREMLGYNQGEWDNSIEAFNELIHPNDLARVWSAARAHLNDHEVFNIEFQVRKKNGVYLWIQSRGQAIWDENKQPKRMSGFFTDISKSKEIDEIKNEFISTVSYELRTPLTSIRGSLALLISGVGGEVNDKAKNLLIVANKNCDRLIDIINDMLDLEKIESGKLCFDMQWHDLPEVMQQSVEQNSNWAEKYNVEFDIREPLENVKIFVDKDRFIQILSNLISNAAKFSPLLGKIEIGTIDLGSMVRIYVADHGPGIPTEFRSRIFEKFSQAANTTKHNGGTGLGLSLAKSIVEQFGGKIGFESEINKGTTFYFDLAKADIPVIAENKGFKEERILVCDDDPTSSDIIKRIFESQHYQVDITFNATQARILLYSRTYHALILDLMLPDENGIDFIQDLRAQKATQKLPIVVLSAVAQDKRQELIGHAVDIVDWIDKPIDSEKLIDTMTKLFSKKHQTILYLEDDKELARIVTNGLNATADVISVESPKQLKDMMADKSIDLLLLDINVQNKSDFEFIKELINDSNKPTIIISDSKLSDQWNDNIKANLVKKSSTQDSIITSIKNVLSQQEERKDA